MKRVNENPPARYPNRPIEEAATPWWIAKIKPRQEKALAFDFINREIEYYLPMLTKITRRKDNNKPRKSIVPLFPGYISFCGDKNRLREVISTGRTVSILEIRHQKRFIGEISQIFQALEQGIMVEPCLDSFPLGTRVIVTSGPLRGINGIIFKIHNQNKLILSVEGLGQAVLSVESAQVKPVPDEE